MIQENSRFGKLDCLPFLSGMSVSAFSINSEQSSNEHFACLYGFFVKGAAAISSSVLTSRMIAPGWSTAVLISSAEDIAMMIFRMVKA